VLRWLEAEQSLALVGRGAFVLGIKNELYVYVEE
jgi:hypothetical protein